MIARRVILRGRVQGVGFRESLVDIAGQYRVAGWVRNRVDGRVEAFIQGESEAVERAIEWCRRGPPAARVSGIEVTEEPPSTSVTGFVRRPTE